MKTVFPNFFKNMERQLRSPRSPPFPDNLWKRLLKFGNSPKKACHFYILRQQQKNRYPYKGIPVFLNLTLKPAQRRRRILQE